MKQVLQNLSDGETLLVEVPVPKVQKGQVLVRTAATLVSSGTERMLMEFGKASYLDKARQQPDKVKQILSKVKTDGLFATYQRVKSKLDQPVPLGYCNAGIVVDSDVPDFQPGDRVISNGPHAEFVRVPKHLCAKIPDDVDFQTASFTVPASIGLQGIRLLNPTIGETIVVLGLGLIGLLGVQILRANGCRVIGIDTQSDRCQLARRFGAETVDLSEVQDPVQFALGLTDQVGVDGVLITAATKSDEVMHQAAEMSRKRGRIVLVGVVGLNLRRDDFFEKELTFQVSASYGPGRYDPAYEEQGQDYPVGFVRWTEQRNFEAVLSLMSSGGLDPKPLVSHSFELNDAPKAYEALSDPSALGISLNYPVEENLLELPIEHSIEISSEKRPVSVRPNVPRVSFLGAGSFATSMLIPAFKEAGASLQIVASSGGFSGVHAGKKFGFLQTTTDSKSLIEHSDTDAVVIATRHDSHAALALDTLRAGKHVFVEKPLCLRLDELDDIEQALGKSSATSPLLLMIGFNRRFAPQVCKVKELLNGGSAAKSFVMTINAGAVPANHWTQDKEVGGGRIIGEACHFIDLLRFLASSPITSYSRIEMKSESGDTVTLQLSFADGSIGSVHYFSNGNESFPKERLEVFSEGGILQLDNFRKLTGFGWPGFSKMNLRRQDKGHADCARAFVDALKNGADSPIPIEEILEVSRVSIELANGSSRNE